MFGTHLSIAGGMVNALHEARRLKLDCVQVFTRNQRQWAVRPIVQAEADDWWSELRRLGWDDLAQRRTVSHNSYLVNLASPDPDLWLRSLRLQRVELQRCEQLGIPLCVIHPGAHMGAAPPRGTPHRLGDRPTRDQRAGLRRIAKALNRLHRQLPGYRTITCLETTAGAGTTLGYDFAHLAAIRDLVRAPERVGFCLDTCHVTAAGYDMSTHAGARDVLDQFDGVCGLGNLMVVHTNDSQGDRGSRVDRHAHIGEGTCGTSCFREIVNHSRLAAVPKVLETPKGCTTKGTEWDRLNVRRLKRLVNRAVSRR